MSIEIIEAFLCNQLQDQWFSMNLSNLSALSQPFLGGLDMVRRQLFTGGQSCLPLGSLVESCLWDAGRTIPWCRYGLTKNMSLLDFFKVLLALNDIFLRLIKSMICPIGPHRFFKTRVPWVSIPASRPTVAPCGTSKRQNRGTSHLIF